jgi:hypothetical protein
LQAAGSRHFRRSGNARIMAVLVGALAGLVLVVFALATGIIPFASNLVLGLAILGGIWFAGFVIAGGFMLRRAGRQPRSPDAEYVRTTLRVVPDAEAPQTGFEWRNRETAKAFFEANGPAAVGGPLAVDEAGASA